MERVGQRMSAAGGALTKSLTLPLALVGGASVKAFASFDSAMTKSLAIMGDVSEELREEMAGSARQMAKETVFSATQAAESYFFLASAGLDAESSIAALPRVARFAQAGMFDMALATDLLTDAQSALGLTIRDDAIANMENMSRVADVLVRANTLANATVEQFSTSLTREAGAALKTFNIAAEEGVAVLAAFADQGVKGEVAGTGLSRILRLMTSAAVNNAEAYKRLNVRVFDAHGSIRNLADIIADLENALGGMSDAQRVAALEALGFQARVQGVILPLMGSSEAIRQYQKDLEDATGFTDKVAKAQMESFTEQMRLVKDQLVDAAITLGQNLAPAIKDFSQGALVPMIETLGRLAESFGKLPAPARNFILILAAVAAAVGPVLLVVGQLVTAFGMLAIAAPGAAAALAAIAGPAGLITIGVAALTTAYLDGRRRVREYREANEDLDKALKDLDKSIRTVGKSTIEGTKASIKKALADRQQAHAALELIRQKAEMERASAGVVSPETEKRSRLAGQAIRKLGEEIQFLHEQLREAASLQSRSAEANAAALAHAERLREAEEELAEAKRQVSEATQGALDAINAEAGASAALLDALLESQEAYDTLNVLLEAGVPLNEALSGAYDKQAQSLLRSAAALEKELSLREEEKELLTSILDLREKIARLKESPIDTVSDIEMPEMEPVFPELDPAALEKMTEDWRNTLGQMSTEMEALQKRAWENIQDIASDAIAEIIKTGEVDFENLFDSILDVVAQMLAKMLVMWLANLAKRVAAEQAAAVKSAAAWSAVESGTGGGGGGWMGILKSLFGMGGGGAQTGAVTVSYDSYQAAVAAGAFEGTQAGVSSGIGGASWSTLGTMFGIAAAAIIVAELGNAFIARQKQKLTAGSFGFDPRDVGDGKSGFFAGSGQHELNEQMVEAMRALRRTFEELERVTGASITLMERIQVNVKGNGRIWVNIGDRLSREVGSLAEAMDLIVTEMLNTAEITGASPAILAALRNSVAESVDELQAEISAALRSEELFLGEEGRTAIREKTNEFFELLEKELELGIIEAQGGSGAMVGLVNSYQANFDRLMGITRDAGEVARQQARAHNAALKMDIARLQVMRAELIAKGALAQAGAGLAGVLGGGAQVMARHAEITAGATKVQAGHAEVMATGAKVTHGMTEVMAVAAQTAGANAEAQGALAQTQAAGATVAMTAAQANAAALAAIDEALAALEGLEVDLDAAAAAARRAGQGGGPGAEMQQLRDLLDQMRFDRLLLGMTELEAGLARLDRQYQEQLKMAHGNAELIAQLTEEYRLQEEQLRRQIQLSAVDTFQGFMGIGEDPFAQLSEGFEGAVSAIEDAGFGAQRTRLMVARLTDEYERQLDVLSRQEFVAIGDSLMGIVDRYFSGVEGFEEFRMRLEQTRFELELANLRARFEILKAEGTLAQAVLNQIQGVFDFIDENPIDWSAFVAPAAPRVQRAARDVNNAFEEMARRLNSAKESIRDFLASLQTGAFGGRSNKQMFEAAQSQFQKIRQGVQAGNIQAIEQFPEVARRFLEIARERFGSTAKFQEILAQVESAGIGALGVSKVREDNVVFDQRFFQQQAHHVQVDKSGHKSVADAVKQGFALQAAEEERSREDILLELRGLRESQEALNQRLAAIEGSRRVRKAS